MLRRIGVLTSLAVTAAMFAGVTSAQAQTNPAVNDSATCVFGGLSGQLNPAIPNTVPDAQNGGVHDVERGSYNFSGNADCVFERPGMAPVQATAVIGSGGFYDNINCGTGYAHDLDSNGTFVDAAPIGLSFGGLRGDPAGYEIPFSGGVGPLIVGPDGKVPAAGTTQALPPALAPHNGTHADGDGGVHAGPGLTPMHGSVVSNYVGQGQVQITPGNAPVGSPPNENCTEHGPNDTPPGPDVDGDTDEFRVTGSLSGTKYQVGANGIAP